MDFFPVERERERVGGRERERSTYQNCTSVFVFYCSAYYIHAAISVAMSTVQRLLLVVKRKLMKRERKKWHLHLNGYFSFFLSVMSIFRNTGDRRAEVADYCSPILHLPLHPTPLSLPPTPLFFLPSPTSHLPLSSTGFLFAFRAEVCPLPIIELLAVIVKESPPSPPPLFFCPFFRGGGGVKEWAGVH